MEARKVIELVDPFAATLKQKLNLKLSPDEVWQLRLQALEGVPGMEAVHDYFSDCCNENKALANFLSALLRGKMSSVLRSKERDAVRPSERCSRKSGS